MTSQHEGISVNCFVCTNPMKVKGAIFTSSPEQTSSDNVDTVHKFHICVDCEPNLINFMIGKVKGVDVLPKLYMLKEMFGKGEFRNCMIYIEGLIDLFKTGEKSN